MQRHFPVAGVTFEAGHQSWEGFAEQPLVFFEQQTIDFITEFSRALLKQGAEYPNLAALGFFLRPSQLNKLAQNYQGEYRPRGLSFHISPSNVSSTAVFSWVCSLLAGNYSIVRLSSRLNDEQQQLMWVLENILMKDRFSKLSQAVRFIRYQRNSQLNQLFSSLSDTRIIWGGDSTIEQFSRYPTPAHCVELRFNDRLSIAVVDVNFWANLELHFQSEQSFKLAGDIMTFSQKACSSPTWCFLLGDESNKTLFLTRLASAMNSNQFIRYSSANERLINSQLLMASGAIHSSSEYGGLMTHCMRQAPLELPHCQFGNLLLPEVGSIDDIYACLPFYPQTCVLLADKNSCIAAQRSILADRFVSPGNALSLDWVWDGIDIVAALSRKIRAWV